MIRPPKVYEECLIVVHVLCKAGTLHEDVTQCAQHDPAGSALSAPLEKRGDRHPGILCLSASNAAG